MAKRSVKTTGLDQRLLNDSPRVQHTLYTCLFWHGILRYLKLTLKKKILDLGFLKGLKNNKEMGRFGDTEARSLQGNCGLQLSTGYPLKWGLQTLVSFTCLALEASVCNAWMSSVVLNPEHLGEL